MTDQRQDGDSERNEATKPARLQSLQVLSEHLVYKRWIKVWDRTVAFPPDGRPVAWDVAASGDFVVAMPYHSADNTVTVVREWWQGPNRFGYGFPGGLWEKDKAGTQDEAIKQELSEEADLKGGKLVPLLPEGHPGLAECKWVRNVGMPYLHLDPEMDQNPLPQDAEELIEVERIPIQQVQDLILKGEMTLVSAQTYWMACKWLRQNGYDLKAEVVGPE